MFRPSCIHLTNGTRRVMNQSPRSYAFLRERTEYESPIPDDRIVPDSDHETRMTPPLQMPMLGIQKTSPKRALPARKRVPDIIELSDDDSEPPFVEEIINLTDGSQSAPEIIEIVRPPLRASKPVHNRAPAAPSARNTNTDRHSDSEDSLPDLSRFAWNGQLTTPRSMVANTAAPTFAETSTITKPPKSSSRGIDTTSYSFTDSQLQPLTKCVSCGLEWTTRKSVAKKLQHIRTCQKKYSFSEETMRLLIERQLEKDTAGQPWKSVEDDPEKELTGESFMDQIVKSTLPKHRKRREVAATTILSVDEQHEIFSKRVEELFPKLLEEEEVNAPPTQALPPSRLGAHAALHNLFETDSPSIPKQYNTAVRNVIRQLSGSPVQSPSVVNSNAKDKRAVQTKKVTQKKSSPKPFNGGSWMPNPSQSTLTEKTGLAHHIQQSPQKELAHPCDVETEDNGNSPPRKQSRLLQAISQSVALSQTRSMATTPLSLSLSSNRRSKAKEASKTSPLKKIKHKLDAISDEEFAASMEMLIRNEQDLWSRVILYEPLDFSVFLKLATGDEVATPKLRRRLRSFLDQKAIHFFNGPDLRA